MEARVLNLNFKKNKIGELILLVPRTDAAIFFLKKEKDWGIKKWPARPSV